MKFINYMGDYQTISRCCHERMSWDPGSMHEEFVCLKCGKPGRPFTSEQLNHLNWLRQELSQYKKHDSQD